MGRPRDEGTAAWATVTEAAEALGVTQQAIYNRIKAGTVPHERDVENERASYRINREWLRAEVERKAAATPATTGELAHEGEIRAAEIIAVFMEHAEAIRAEIEKQNSEFLPLEREQVENQRRILEEFASTKAGLEKNLQLQEKVYSLLLRVEEAERTKAERGKMERRSFWRRIFGD